MRASRFVSSASGILAIMLVAGGAQAQVVNGGFESPGTGFKTVNAGQTYGNWTCEGPSDIEFVKAEPNGNLPGLENSAYEGSYWIDLVGVGSPSGIYQKVVTSVGQSYEISFAFSGNPYSGGQLMSMAVIWNGVVKGVVNHDTTGKSGNDMGWTLHNFTVEGTGDDMLTFRGLSGSGSAGPALDAVSMRPVPSLPTLALAGLGSLVLACRRR